MYNGLEYPLELSRIFSETEGTRAHISDEQTHCKIRTIHARALNSLDNRTTRAARASRSPLLGRQALRARRAATKTRFDTVPDSKS